MTVEIFTVETTEEGQVLVDGKPVQSLQQPLEGEPPPSPGFTARLRLGAEVAAGIARMRKAQQANPGGDRLPIPLNIYLQNLARKSRLSPEKLTAYYGLAEPDRITTGSIPGWSAVARNVALPREDANRQLFCAVLAQQQHPEFGALRGAAFAGSPDDRRAELDRLRAAMLQERRFTPEQEAELRQLEGELERAYHADHP